jgi:CheY-like chemotaxis protein
MTSSLCYYFALWTLLLLTNNRFGKQSNKRGRATENLSSIRGRTNPVTAIVEFKPNFYDLLLNDVNMPLMDGFQLAQNLVRGTSMSGFAL